MILKEVPLYPGAVLTYLDLRRAERNLVDLDLFEGKPAVEVLNADGPYADILIRVREKPPAKPTPRRPND